MSPVCSLSGSVCLLRRRRRRPPRRLQTCYRACRGLRFVQVWTGRLRFRNPSPLSGSGSGSGVAARHVELSSSRKREQQVLQMIQNFVNPKATGIHQRKDCNFRMTCCAIDLSSYTCKNNLQKICRKIVDTVVRNVQKKLVARGVNNL